MLNDINKSSIKIKYNNIFAGWLKKNVNYFGLKFTSSRGIFKADCSNSAILVALKYFCGQLWKVV